MSNYEEKYKKALKSIEEIIKANKQIKDQLDALRIMRQNDLESFANIQKEEFKKAYDVLLKEKNTIYISYQTLELENQKLKYTISQLQHQVSLYKNDRFQKLHQQRQTLLSNQQPQALNTEHPSPRRSDTKDMTSILRQKQAQFHRTIQNYEEHHSNLQRNNKRLQERIGQLQNKLMSTEKNWRVKYQAKELEVIDIKALTRQQFTDQITILRKENSSLKLINNDLSLKIENVQKNTQFNKNLQNYDWQADLVQEMINVKANLQPLRQQINQLQELNVYEKEQSIRQRTNLQTRVLELEAQVERQNETIKDLQRKSIQSYQQRRGMEQKQQLLKKYEEQNQLLNGKIIVMQSRQIALRNRTGQELQQRVLQFQNRIQLLLNNKQGLRQLRQVGIHQLLALKAYIMQLDSKLKELMLSNAYLLKKYKSYKQKYQGSLKQHKQYGMTINSLKMKILGYDKLVIKLQGQLQRMVKTNQNEYVHVSHRTVKQTNENEIYKKKYELMKQKLQIQQKYKEQEMQTFKLNYQTKIMELTIRIQEVKSLKQTIELYRSKNQELQGLLSKKQTQLFESKILSNSKVNASENQPTANNRQTKDIINNLHISLKQNDQTIFKLQSQLRNKEDNYKRTITKLQREINDLKEDHARQLSKKEMDYNITLDQEVKKYKIKINELQHNYHIVNINHKDQHSKKSEEVQGKIRKLQARLQQAESKRQEQVFNRRRLQKQIIDLNHDKQQLQRGNNDLQLKINQYKVIQRQYQQLKIKLSSNKTQNKDSYLDYELQSKDTIIKRLNNEIFQLKSSLSGLGEKDITVSSQKNEIYYLKKEIEQLNDTINKYNNQIIFLKGALDTNKTSYNNQFQSILQEKENVIGRLRKDLSAKQNKIHEYQQQISTLQQSIRKFKRELTEMERNRQQIQRLQALILEKDKIIQKLKNEELVYDEQIQKLSRELTYLKQNYQKINYQLLQKNDQLSRLHLQMNTISIRNKQSLESKYMQQIIQKQKQLSKLNSDYLTLRSNFNMMEQDKNYHQENYKRANNDIFNLRGQINQFQEENTDLSNQIYYKTQEINKLQYNIENYKQEIQELSQKSQDNYKIRTEIFSLKSDISNFQEEIFNKQAANSRLSNQINYIRSQFMQLEEQLAGKQDYINKISYQYNLIKGNQDQIQIFTQQKDKSIQKLTTQLNSLRNKYRDLEEEMEERQQAFSMLSQNLSQLKSNLTYYEEQIEERNTQIAKINNEKEILKTQIVRLNQAISDKNQELNRAKQEVFSIRLESSQKDYNEKIRIDQEIYSLKNKITTLQHEVQDKDSQIRRLHIQIDSVRHQPAAEPSISQQQVQQLRSEISKRQRQLINMKFDIQDKQYQLQTMTNNATMLRNTLNQYQQRMISEREEYQRTIRQYNQRQRSLKQEITYLNQELQSKKYIPQTPKPYSFASTYTQQEMNTVRQQYNLKQRELNALKYQLQDKLYILQTLQSKAKMQQNLLHQIEQQYNEDRQQYQIQIQEYINQQRQHHKNLQEMQQHYQQQLTILRNRKSSEHSNQVTQTANASPYDQTMLLRQYVQEIDRLNRIIKELQEDIASFKLKLSSMINQQNRIQENLVTMVLLFTEVQSIRDRIKSKETEIGQVRRSFMQMAVSGEIQTNKMSRLMGLVNNNNINSSEQIDNESVDKQSSVNVFSQIQEAHERMEKSKQPEPEDNAEEHLKEYIEQYVQDHIEQPREAEEIVVNQSGSSEESDQQEEAHQRIETTLANTVVVQKQTVQRGSSQVSGSLIQQLQKEQVNDSSQVRGGQITIKIPSQQQQQYISTNIVQQIPAYNQTKIVQIQPQYIQMGGIRVIQPSQHQHQQQIYISQQNTPYNRQNMIIQGSPTQSAVIQTGAIPQQANIIRPINYYSMAAPINPQPFRSIP